MEGSNTGREQTNGVNRASEHPKESERGPCVCSKRYCNNETASDCERFTLSRINPCRGGTVLAKS